MPSEKRQRQDEGRLTRRVAEVSASKKQQRNRMIRNLGGILVVLLIGAALFSWLGGDDGDDEVVTDTTTTVDPSASTTTVASNVVEVTYPGPGAKVTGDTPCPKADGSSERTTSFEKAPPTCIQDGKTYTAKVETTEGDMVFTLDQSIAPIAVNNFVVLGRYHYFDGVPFHRIIPGFVDQAGTPVDQASPDIETNPGYTFADELPSSTDSATVYPDGTLAMANSGANTNSSQFFIVVDSGGSQLEVKYTPFGKVTEGLDIAKKINAFGDAATNGTPTKDIKITKVTIQES